MNPIHAHFAHFHPNVIMVFGALLLFGVAGGMIANRIKWMPTITAFMLLGTLIGPDGAGLISKTMLSESAALVDIALGLILYRLGNMLHPKAMLRSKRLMVTSALSTALTFLAGFVLVRLSGNASATAALIGGIVVSSSPAVLVHVSEELHAEGPVSERAKSLVALNNLFSFLIFSVALPFAMVTHEKSLGDVFLVPLFRLAVAAAVGIGIGFLAIRIARLLGPEDEHYRFAIVVGAVMLTLGLSSSLGASALLAPLVLGITTRGLETRQVNLSRVGLGEGGDLFYIILFVMAGAEIHLQALAEMGFAPLFLALARCAGIFAGIFIAARLTGADKAQTVPTTLLLIPMAGMAIGLVATTSNLVPEMGVRIADTVYAMVALFETVGPFAVTAAFRMAGEAHKGENCAEICAVENEKPPS